MDRTGQHSPILLPATYNVKIRDAANPACIITLNAAVVITQPTCSFGCGGKDQYYMLWCRVTEQ